ncbi:hypothetical protein A3H89_00515 [Candidatus Amesbacteria bacterium RIFCSPLOWO2_02_FULL_48_11]|nr:MAG: hypothetical protein A2V48_01655 [Candidatus Amesbacteria bacterium RBG_19FT_COMBO_48_16]OGD06978.1 MAG: hypothetical protein A3H89_00515 [Candidatus Amesbacteria bacterium RIFCSPLOWO2_02_FULL_48_11]
MRVRTGSIRRILAFWEDGDGQMMKAGDCCQVGREREKYIGSMKDRGPLDYHQWPKELRGLEGMHRMGRLVARGTFDPHTKTWDFSRMDIGDLATIDMLREVGMWVRNWDEALIEELKKRLAE